MSDHLVQPWIYASEKDLSPNDGRGETMYVSHDAYWEIIDYALETFGVTKYQLARLLGLSNPLQIYRWVSRTPNMMLRPSPKYLARLCKLHELHNKGVSLVEIGAIDWITRTAGRSMGGGPDRMDNRFANAGRRRRN